MTAQGKQGITINYLLIAIVVSIFLYEWRIFQWVEIRPYVNAIKLAVPLFLFAVLSLHRIKITKFSPFNRYLLYLALFYLWALIPSCLSDYSEQALLQWGKFSCRALLGICIGLYFFEKPRVMQTVMKVLVIVGVLTLLQFVVLDFTFLTGTQGEPLKIVGLMGKFFGPWGLLGNQAALMHFPGLSFPVLKLTGYWKEPSNASGYLFAVMFLAWALFSKTGEKRWQIAGILLFFAGFLTLSNAGYLALGCALVYKGFAELKAKKFKFTLKSLSLICIAIVFITTALLGRIIVAEHAYGNGYLRAITGVRNSVTRKMMIQDPSNGRFKNYLQNLKAVEENPWGVGLRLPGENKQGTSFTLASANAFIHWLAYTGIIGASILLLMLFQVCKTAFSYPTSPYELHLFLAWIAATVQQTLYGTWMTPFYFVLSMFVFASVYHYQKGQGT